MRRQSGGVATGIASQSPCVTIVDNKSSEFAQRSEGQAHRVAVAPAARVGQPGGRSVGLCLDDEPVTRHVEGRAVIPAEHCAEADVGTVGGVFAVVQRALAVNATACLAPTVAAQTQFHLKK